MAASVVGLGLLGLGGTALAQEAPKARGPARLPRAVPVAQTPARTVESPAPPLAGPVQPVQRIRPVAAVEPAEMPHIQLTVLQQPGADARTTEGSSYDLLVEPPGPHRVFRLESEAQLRERMRQEAKEGRLSGTPERIEFPPVPVISTDTHTPGRRWEPLCFLVEPNYVCHKKLYFEEINSERYGWDLGFVQPVLSAGAFYRDLFFLPYYCGTAPGRPECSAGYRLPGDPVPLMLYPPELSVTGLWAQSSTLLLAHRFFPGQRAFPPAFRISANPAENPGGGGGPPGGLPFLGQ